MRNEKSHRSSDILGAYHRRLFSKKGNISCYIRPPLIYFLGEPSCDILLVYQQSDAIFFIKHSILTGKKEIWQDMRCIWAWCGLYKRSILPDSVKHPSSITKAACYVDVLWFVVPWLNDGSSCLCMKTSIPLECIMGYSEEWSVAVAHTAGKCFYWSYL